MRAYILVLAAIVFGSSVLVGNALTQLSLDELRRRARSGRDARLYRLASFGRGAKFILAILAATSFTILVTEVNEKWQTILISLTAMWTIIGFTNRPKPVGRIWRLADILSGFFASTLAWLNLKHGHSKQSHTGLYEKDDLLILLNRQASQVDSRIAQAELEAARAVLSFGDKKVSDAMTTRAKAKIVAESESIGPHLLDELHKAQADSFVVVRDLSKSAKLHSTGALYLEDALGHPGGGLVKSVMHPSAESIDEDLPLVQALETFLTKKYHIAPVINGFDELVGVLSLGDILEQILGKRSKPEAKKQPEDAKITSDAQSSKQQH